MKLSEELQADLEAAIDRVVGEHVASIEYQRGINAILATYLESKSANSRSPCCQAALQDAADEVRAWLPDPDEPVIEYPYGCPPAERRKIRAEALQK